MKVLYGDYVTLTEQPTQEVFNQCVEELKKAIPNDIDLKKCMATVIYKTPEETGEPFIWTIALKVEELEE